jgi:hydroxyacylglutathione hydrolase
MLEFAILPCLRDNYAYAIVDREAREAVVVDPSEEAPVSAFLEGEGLRLRHLLATHHHADHVGGAAALVARHRVSLVAHDVDAARLRAGGMDAEGVGEGALFVFGGAAFELVHVPGHTLGAACFVVHEPQMLPRLFTGDTLFLGGCGRVFEGDAAMLRSSLERIASLAAEALVYCGHEYTAANLAFACAAEPANVLAREALSRAREATCTIPGRLTVERATNPFLRTRGEARLELEGMALAGSADEVFAALRRAKNTFRAA